MKLIGTLPKPRGMKGADCTCRNIDIQEIANNEQSGELGVKERVNVCHSFGEMEVDKSGESSCLCQWEIISKIKNPFDTITATEPCHL